MLKFKKKPVVIEAQQVNEENGNEVAKWCGGVVVPTGMGFYISIRTLEGEMSGSIGDWIICGVKGEFYPCKPDIFESTYELVEEE